MESQFLIRFIRDNLPFLLFIFFLAVLLGGWVVFESARSLLKRDDVDKLQRRVFELEREQARFSNQNRAPVRRNTSDPQVLSTRWVSRGGAATTSDGGCLVLVDDVIGEEGKALLTIRIDGMPLRQRHPINVGESVELPGKSGYYTVEIGSISGMQTQISAWLRSRHSAS
jgi:hypothetical protein